MIVKKQLIILGRHVAISVRVRQRVTDTGRRQNTPDQDIYIQKKMCVERHAIII